MRAVWVGGEGLTRAGVEGGRTGQLRPVPPQKKRGPLFSRSHEPARARAARIDVEVGLSERWKPVRPLERRLLERRRLRERLLELPERRAARGGAGAGLRGGPDPARASVGLPGRMGAARRARRGEFGRIGLLQVLHQLWSIILTIR